MKLKLVVGILILIILGFTVFGENGLLNLVRYQRQRQALVQESARLREENEQLKKEIELLKSDRGYIERLAREELGMVKPGELVFQFAEQREQRPTSP